MTARLAELGCTAAEANPDVRDVDEIFRNPGAFSFAMADEEHLRNHRDQLKDTMVRNAEKGIAPGATDVAGAETRRAALPDRVVEFLAPFDYLPCSTTRFPPFPIDTGRVREIDGVQLETYIDRMDACRAITETGGPSIPVPPASPRTGSRSGPGSEPGYGPGPSPRRIATSRRSRSPTPGRASPTSRRAARRPERAWHGHGREDARAGARRPEHAAIRCGGA